MKLIKYSSKYFLSAQKIIKESKIGKISTIRFFCFHNETCISGINYLKDLINKESKNNNLNSIVVYSIKEGTIVNAFETVMIIKGLYYEFAYLENIIDGVLSRMSSVATNCLEYIKNTGNKKIIFMADRSDFYLNQPIDGYAAYIAGIKCFVTNSLMKLLPKDNDAEYLGTMSHSLIQQCEGNLLLAIELFKNTFPNEKIIALIDYYNDCLNEIEKIANSKFKNEVFAVRVDTSKSLIDNCLKEHKDKNEYYGVSHYLILKIRNKLDSLNMNNVKIIASSGIDLNKIKEFEKLKTPIDIYGIGSALIAKRCHFAADLIKIEDKYESKFGRNFCIEKDFQKLTKW
ncbi:MAG: nicotinate phosphoribosyltransferase [Mycoplasmoidaceae bacterium]